MAAGRDMRRWIPWGFSARREACGTTTAVQTNMVIYRVMEAANWQRLSTLQGHYYKPQCLQSLTGILNVTS